ncbi:MAG TPA: hypothetical protein VG407_04560 [Caulobacteraceae bacterium]|jgi:hypothetical protein|nr:hypothetical protein [Caulobacteraceae bacterium]
MTKRSAETTTPEPKTKSADEVELKRWHPQPPEEKTFQPQSKADDIDLPPKVIAPHAKQADKPLNPDKKHDQLAEAKPEAKKDRKRQEALVDEGLEETFPASDPVSVKHIT